MNTIKAFKAFIIYSSFIYGGNLVTSMDNQSNIYEDFQVRDDKVLPLDFTVITRRDSEGGIFLENDPNDFKLFSYPNTYAFLYIFNEDSKCVEFKFRGETVWKSQDPSKYYPVSIYFATVSKEAIMYFRDDICYTFRLVKGGWKRIKEESRHLKVKRTTNEKLVSLEINNKLNTDYFQYSQNGNEETYRSWARVKFNVVTKGGVEIWRSRDDRRAQRLDLYFGDEEKIAILVYLEDNSKQLLIKNNPDPPAEDLGTRMLKCGYKIITSDEPEGKNFKTNDTTKFESTSSTNKSLFIQFEEDMKYVELKYKDKTVWTYDWYKGKNCVQSLHFVPEDKKIVVWLKDKNPVVYNVVYRES